MAVTTLALLADSTRLRILWLLARGDREVGALSALTGATASATSQHLAKLRHAGLVSMRKAGSQHVYIARGSHVRPSSTRLCTTPTIASAGSRTTSEQS